ncbi:MAG: tyrosine-type recombinase/integrase [Candidatus Thermoplasmatota archaeon]|nr:tyrosine-type recombinase/integrase [Candidatus Thermoplasmatota archaeon]
MKIGSINDELVEAYIKDARRRRLTERTIENYRSCIRIFLEFLNGNARDVDIERLRDFLDHLANEQDLADASLNRYFSALASFYEFLEFEGIVEKNLIPMFRKRYLCHLDDSNNRQSERQIVSIEQMAEFINSILDPRDKAVITLLAKTGMRRNELVRIDVEDINWEENAIILKPTRKRKNRLVFFDDEMARILKRWTTARESRIKDSDVKALFLNQEGNRLKRNGIYSLVTKHAERVGIHDPSNRDLSKRFTPHCCRHWFTTHLIRSGMRREMVKELRGDVRLEAVDLYHHIDRNELRRAYLAHIPQLGI